MPVYNVEEIYLRKAIESVINQTYSNWELCIADDASTEGHIKKVLDEYNLKDSRIKVDFLDENKGISEASNAALVRSTGHYVAFLDNDDELIDSALEEVVCVLEEEPNCDYVYSDEAMIDRDGKRILSINKPDYSPDYLMTNNYANHFSVYSRRVYEMVGGLRTICNGSQDFDFVLRVVEKSRVIKHIKKELYLWRMLPTSVAGNPNAKPYAVTGAQIAIKEAIERRGLKGSVTTRQLHYYDVTYDIENDPMVSIIIEDKGNSLYDIEGLLSNILTTQDYDNVEILWVSNRPVSHFTDNILSKITLFSDHNKTLAQLKNTAADSAKGDYLLFLQSNITVLSNGFIEGLLMYSQLEHTGLVGSKLEVSGQEVLFGGLVIVDLLKYENFIINNITAVSYTFSDINLRNLPDVVRNCSSTTGAFMVDKVIFKEVGGFDHKFDLVFQEIDLGLKVIAKGYYNVWTPLISATLNYTEINLQNLPLNSSFVQKWATCLENGDNYYNNTNISKINLGNKIRHVKNVCIFGAAFDGEKCLKFLNYRGVNTSFFVDNSKLKQGELFNGVRVYSVEYAISHLSQEIDAIVLLSASAHKEVMRKQIVDLGFEKEILEY